MASTTAAADMTCHSPRQVRPVNWTPRRRTSPEMVNERRGMTEGGKKGRSTQQAHAISLARSASLVWKSCRNLNLQIISVLCVLVKRSGIPHRIGQARYARPGRGCPSLPPGREGGSPRCSRCDALPRRRVPTAGRALQPAHRCRRRACRGSRPALSCRGVRPACGASRDRRPRPSTSLVSTSLKLRRKTDSIRSSDAKRKSSALSKSSVMSIIYSPKQARGAIIP